MKQSKPSFNFIIPLLILGYFFITIFYLIGKPVSLIWVMDEGNQLNETYLSKICPDGSLLYQLQFGQSGSIGFNPLSNSVWAPELNDIDRINYDQVVEVSIDGKVVNRFQGHRTSLLAVDPNDGSIWTAEQFLLDPSQSLVTKLEPNGKLIRRVDGFFSPYSFAIDPRDGSLWVADGGSADGTSQSRLVHLNADGTKIFELPVSGFFSNAPHQIAVNPENGEVWFTSTFPGTATKLSQNGQVLAQVEGFDRPMAITINPINGNVWVADYTMLESGSVTKLDSNGNILFILGTWARPQLVAVNPFDSIVWIGLEGAIAPFYDNGQMAGDWIYSNKPKSMVFVQNKDDFIANTFCVFNFYSDIFLK